MIRYVATVLGFCIGGGVSSVFLLTVVILLYATLTTQAGVSIPGSLLLSAYFAVCTRVSWCLWRAYFWPFPSRRSWGALKP